MARPPDIRSPDRPVRFALAIATALAFVSAWAAQARGPLPRPQPDCEAARCAVADATASTCPCDTATSHGSYVRCVSLSARALVVSKALPIECKGAVVRCAARSTCGRPQVAACRHPIVGGGERCRITRSAVRCETTGGAATIGSCCRACPTTTTTNSTTTSTVSTTTTTTSSTTTTLFPCGGVFPACFGSCPPGLTCTAPSLTVCVCN